MVLGGVRLVLADKVRPLVEFRAPVIYGRGPGRESIDTAEMSDGGRGDSQTVRVAKDWRVCIDRGADQQGLTCTVEGHIRHSVFEIGDERGCEVGIARAGG